jgi:protocatechuate 3,4-dioxygenase beta subunit
MSKVNSLKARNTFQPFTRRDFVVASLGFGGLTVAAFGTPGQAPAIVTSKNRVMESGCLLSPEQTEGPYYVDKRIVRQDITEGKPGIPVRLQITVLDARSCSPLPNAAVDLWHCDATGLYSGYTANSPDGGMFGGPPPRGSMPDGGFRPPPALLGDRGDGPPRPMHHHGPSDNQTFFRGVQLTDGTGAATFATVYPGWYMGRAIHIHLKVRTAGSVENSQYRGGHVCHTGQLFFPEDISDAVARLAPYRGHHTQRTRQDEDDIFTDQHGSGFVVTVAQTNKRAMEEGFVAHVVLGVDPSAEPAEVGFGGGPPPPRG